LPLDPGDGVVARCEPAVDRAPQLRFASEAPCEGQVLEVEPEAAAQVAQGPQPVQLGEAVDPVAGARPRRNDEPVLLEIPEHPRRPAGLGGGGADGQGPGHAADLTTT